MKPVRIVSRLAIRAARDKGGPPRFEGVAYKGGVIFTESHPGGVILDLKGYERTRSSLPLLMEHNPERPVGTIGDVRVSGNTLSIAGAVSHPGKDAQEIVAAADNGHDWQLSVGAHPALDAAGQPREDAIEWLPAGEKATVNGREIAGPVTIIRHWSLHEVSVVSIGADQNTTLSLAARFLKGKRPMDEKELRELLEREGINVASLDAETLKAIANALGKPSKSGDKSDDDEEAVRASQAATVAAAFPDIKEMPAILAQAQRERWPAAKLKNKLELERIIANRPAYPFPPKRYEPPSTKELVDALQARYRPGKAQSGVQAARPPRLLDVMRRQLEDAGLDAPDNERELIRAAWTMNKSVRAGGVSSMNAPHILQEYARRELIAGYDESPRTFEAFARKVSLNDFRPHSAIRLSSLENLAPVARGGQIEAGVLTDERVYTVNCDTFGRVWGIDRKDMINDDLAGFADMASAIGKAAARSLADHFYAMFMNNQADFFTAAHANLITGADSVLNVDSLAAAITKMRLQRNERGDDLDIQPAVLLVPPELEIAARQLLTSSTVQFLGDPSEIVSRPTGNSLMNSLELVIEPRLSNTRKFKKASTKAWFLFSRPAYAPCVVGYLDGVDRPTIEEFGLEQEASHLAYQWRCFFDFGAGFGDWRCSLKATGE